MQIIPLSLLPLPIYRLNKKYVALDWNWAMNPAHLQDSILYRYGNFKIIHKVVFQTKLKIQQLSRDTPLYTISTVT